MSWRILEGDAVDRLRELEPGSAQTCVTSPPYFGLRDYGEAGQVGLEATPDEYVARLVEVFREVRRVLRDDGTVWLNLGDSYNSSPPGNKNPMSKSGLNGAQTSEKYRARLEDTQQRQQEGRSLVAGCKPKDLLGIPWMVAFALRADGWYLRSDIIWAKPNPMPESVTDRPTKAHEYVFLLSKSPRYFWDADAVREESAPSTLGRAEAGYGPTFGSKTVARQEMGLASDRTQLGGFPTSRNKRSVWTVATQPFPGAHFAVFPPKLIEPCILAGSAKGDTVLDPFAGSGTTGVVARWHGRSFVGCELNPTYAAMARDRIETEGRVGYRAPGVPEQIAGQMGLLGEALDRMVTCEDCDITERVGNLTAGCPQCGETMVPAEGDPLASLEGEGR